MIGLSVSSCIRDMAQGLVDPATVEKIIAGTATRSDAEVGAVVELYRGLYWAENPDACEKLYREMLAAGKIEQPRLVTGRAPMIGGGHWVQDEDQIVWTDPLFFPRNRL